MLKIGLAFDDIIATIGWRDFSGHSVGNHLTFRGCSISSATAANLAFRNRVPTSSYIAR